MEHPPEFQTERLPLAAFLHVGGQLRFLRCDRVGGGRVAYVFGDPDHAGEQLELAFESGAQAPASALFASLKFLRRQTSEALGERRENGMRRSGNEHATR